MKKKIWFVFCMLLFFTAFTFCTKDDLTNSEDGLTSKSTGKGNSNAKVILPTLELVDIINITSNRASAGYKVTDPGQGSERLTRGVCWSTAPNPTVNDKKTNYLGINRLSKGDYFNADLVDLNPATIYYVRAYAANSTGTSYSNGLSFTTGVSMGPSVFAAIFPLSLSCTGVIIAYDILDNGGNPVLNKGVCWSTALNPTVDDKKGFNENYGMLINGVRYSQNSQIDGLQPATEYHARPFFVTIAGTFYGEDISFLTHSLPVVTTDSITDVTSTSAIIHGNLISNGGSFVVERGICWDVKSHHATVRKSGGFGTAAHFIEQEVQSYDAAGKFTVHMTNLTPGTLYYVFTFVGVMTGIEYGDQAIGYGKEITFRTKL